MLDSPERAVLTIHQQNIITKTATMNSVMLLNEFLSLTIISIHTWKIVKYVCVIHYLYLIILICAAYFVGAKQRQ